MSKTLELIENKLRESLHPTQLEVSDFSAEHAGHAGSRPGGETHFRIKIESESFKGLNKVQQHRLVYEALALDLKQYIHALSLETIIPNEK